MKRAAGLAAGPAGLAVGPAGLAVLAMLAWAGPAAAADIAKARTVLGTVYDIGLYESELDRVMAEADSRGVYGGAGSTPTSRARDKQATRASMVGQRDAVLRLAAEQVAACATDAQLDAILRLAANPAASVDQRTLDGAVAAVKGGFNDALWDQVARVARGNAEFRCTKDQKSRC